MINGSLAAWSAACCVMYSASAIACSTTLRRSFARTGLLKGERADGDWMTPAMVAASASETLLTSLPKNSREASATPKTANDPRWPSGISFKYISRISSFEARCVSTSATQISSALRFGERARASWSVMFIPSNFGRNTLRTNCWVIVEPPAR